MHLRSRQLLAAFAITAGLGLVATGGAQATELDRVPAAAPGADDASDIVQRVAFESRTLPPMERLRPKPVEIDAFACSGEHAWLLDRGFEMRDDIPRGVEVDRGSLVRVEIGGELTIDEATGYVTGWSEGGNTAANWHLSATSFATVTAHCTSDPTKAYRPADRP